MTAVALPADTPAVAADKAWRRACLAIDRNLPVEAGRWLRVLRAIQKLLRAAAPQVETPDQPTSAPRAEWEKVESVSRTLTQMRRRRPSAAVPAAPRPP